VRAGRAFKASVHEAKLGDDATAGSAFDAFDAFDS